ncbi:fimbria/pilus periplasmic chaperone [Klebsiella spallanzanii]|uniref:fimbria/pilus periplasmic chaperone n=1 Tax=Klebsiella spallanzanii TaxID=2587528 RepID=UPI002599C170|nr:fimbria/pilus periplasmic chaperone [Klebsiella spallanzanii]MDM4205873.1 fimbria/pilus periplasmic chaperone [Klebsiella spallanzanii]
MKIKSNLCAFLFASTVPLCHANMSVYPMAVDMNDQGESSVRVISRTSDVQYVKTSILNITSIGTGQEKETEIKNGDPTAIVVMPPKFALPAGATKMVRLVAMEPVQEEATYRVKFEAVPQLDDPLEGTKDTKSQLTINLIWGVLVSVPPENPQLKMSLLADGKITNIGNQRFKILKTGLCKKSQSDKDCVWQDVDKNIYPRASYAPKNILNYDRIVVQYWNWIDKSKHSQDFPIH